MPNKEIHIKKVLLRKHDGCKIVVIPRRCNIEAGDYVFIKKVDLDAK